MPPWAATLIVGGFTILTNALILAYYFGRLSQRVDTNDRQIADIGDDQDSQWSHINDLRADVGKIKGKIGVNGH